jgi:hypothetical protein
MKMYNTPIALELEMEAVEVTEKVFELYERLKRIAARCSHAEMGEYIQYGVLRRLQVLRKCIISVFRIFPPDRAQVLSPDELSDVCINAHAFFMNVFGLLDNIAWTVVFREQRAQNQQAINIDRRKVGLYHRGTRVFLSHQFIQYLDSPHIKDWHDEHLKEFRDALAHRIPLYVPPYFQNLQTGEKTIGAAFVGSINTSKVMKLHPQLLADFNTVNEILHKFVEHEIPPDLHA